MRLFNVVNAVVLTKYSMVHGQSTGTIFRYPDCVDGPLAHNLVCNPNAPERARATALVNAMNITEKLAQLVDNAPGVPRLGLPAYEWWAEALHGVAFSPGTQFNFGGSQFGYATSFAQPILTAAAFDDDSIEKIATVISTEARAFSNAGRAGLDFFTPNINPYRDPRWGRGQETPGEDPFRTSEYTRRLLLGLEGGVNPKVKKVLATCKHFVGYDLEQAQSYNGFQYYNRFAYNAEINTQDLAEYYLPPFQQCARDSKVAAMMCSYNTLNGIGVCADKYLMGTIARDHWKWTDRNQYIASDCNAVHHLYSQHNYTSSDAEATAIAIISGTDQVCQVGNTTDSTGAYQQKLLPQGAVDLALVRQYQGLVSAGYFNPPSQVPYRKLSWQDVNTPDAQALALRTAEDGIVLLKNDGLLPLSLKRSTTVAMIGFWANGTNVMQGDYSGNAPFLHSPIYAAQQAGVKFIYANGPVKETTETGNWTEPALAAAKKADIILYFGGISTAIEVEGLDRGNVSWPLGQAALIRQLAQLDKKMAIVQLGTQVDDSEWLKSKHISSIVWAGYPGQDGGTAVLNILTGKTAPAGRLPITQYPDKYTRQVAPYDQSLRQSKTNPGRTYKWYDGAVLPFGYGLHYTKFTARFATQGYGATTFSIDRLKRSCHEAYPDLCAFPLDVDIRVTNVGKVSSDFVALAFLSGKYGPQPYPIKELAAYTRLKSIKPGQTAQASLTMKLGNLARRDPQGNLVLYPGTYTVLLDVPTQATMHFTLTGSPWVLDRFPQPPKDATGGCSYCKPQTVLSGPLSGQ